MKKIKLTRKGKTLICLFLIIVFGFLTAVLSTNMSFTPKQAIKKLNAHYGVKGDFDIVYQVPKTNLYLSKYDNYLTLTHLYSYMNNSKLDYYYSNKENLVLRLDDNQKTTIGLGTCNKEFADDNLGVFTLYFCGRVKETDVKNIIFHYYANEPSQKYYDEIEDWQDNTFYNIEDEYFDCTLDFDLSDKNQFVKVDGEYTYFLLTGEAQYYWEGTGNVLYNLEITAFDSNGKQICKETSDNIGNLGEDWWE